MTKKTNIIDCTLRDGGYYNNWDFSKNLIHDYLNSMNALGISYVELGFRSLKNDGFKGACAFTTDNFIASLPFPKRIKLGVMINASEIICYDKGISVAIEKLMGPKDKSQLSFVRIACHIDEFERVLPISKWLNKQGYVVMFNIMQIACCTTDKIIDLSRMADKYPIDVLYFADSLGSLSPSKIANIISSFRVGWSGNLGFHAHDSMGRAVINTVFASESGVTWVDGTVMGMGRGPGNAQTEYIVTELGLYKSTNYNIIPLLNIIKNYFKPLHSKYKWGTNLFYFLSGKYDIHPTFTQEMLSDGRDEKDIFLAINFLKDSNSKRFNPKMLNEAINFYEGEPCGEWDPCEMIEGRDVLIIGAGSSIHSHKNAVEEFIKRHSPFVIALNAHQHLSNNLIDVRAACHPIKIFIDSEKHIRLPQKLIVPRSMLPQDIKDLLSTKEVLDFGVEIKPGTFEFHENYVSIPARLVLPYVLSVVTRGKAKRIFLSGFDGYDDNTKHGESATIFDIYQKTTGALPLVSITPTRYELPCKSVYALI